MSARAELIDAVLERNGVRLLDGTSFSVETGEFVALVGPNGAGKTTALRALTGQWRLSAGAALINDAPAADMGPRARARILSYLPQMRPAAWPIAVEEIAALGRYAFGRPGAPLSGAEAAAIDRALEDVGLGAKRRSAISAISGGENARAHIARALASDAPLLALDEPAASLDPYHGLRILQALRDRADRGAGVIIAIHDLALAARFCDRAVLLNAGRILASGPPQAALSAQNLRAAYGVDAELIDLGFGPAFALRGLAEPG